MGARRVHRLDGGGICLFEMVRCTCQDLAKENDKDEIVRLQDPLVNGPETLTTVDSEIEIRQFAYIARLLLNH